MANADQPQTAKYRSPLEDQPASVYFIRAQGTARCKVGYAKSVIAREKALQVGVVEPLITEAFITFETRKQARDTERKLHKHLRNAGRSLKGEWFRMMPSEIFSLAQVFRNREGVVRVSNNFSINDDL